MYSGHYNESADVWAYGIVLIELMTHRSPYREDQQREYWPFVDGLRNQSIKPVLPTSEELPDETMRNLIEQCVHFIPHLRPNFPQIEKVLTGINV